ncbi:hypothetical protein LCGC14_1539950 [marine sediment metagenome]|uniref:Uncharacterized protein n=1 Tax=marine sediment metagenome TaxID=412755 RepID=A0A0F9L9E3_9ZZZZ
MPTLEKPYNANIVKKIRSRKKRRIYMTNKDKAPRTEQECIIHVRKFLSRNNTKDNTHFDIMKDNEIHFVAEEGKCKFSDAVIYDNCKLKVGDSWIQKPRKIIYLEFEEHKAPYSILENAEKCPSIHVPLRKLHYYRPFNAQYWIKIDRDGTPICIPYRYIANNSGCINDIGAQGKFTSKGQRNMIMAAKRDKDGTFPAYVLTSWRAVFKEFKRILTAYKSGNPIKLNLWE